jgi:pimeloyl-ACP methyl ester carboxylesterase
VRLKYDVSALQRGEENEPMSTHSSLSETPVAWMLDGITIDATLTRPPTPGPFPAVVFVAGSGPTDRNWNTPLLPGSNGSAALLAHMLTANDFVTLRYDKRASGLHAQENVQRLAGNISMHGHAAELAGAIALLAKRPDVDPTHIFVLGNSEGCIHALNYELQAPAYACKGLILTAAPARPISAVARSQVTAQLAAVPEGDTLLAAFDAAMQEFAAGRPVPLDERFPEGIRMLILGLTSPVNQPFARELWVTDAAALLERITVPVLIVIGKQDIQVDWQADGAVFEALAAQRPNISIVYPEHANHVLKHEPRSRAQLSPGDAVTTYNAESAVLDAETVAAIVDWLHTHQ